MIFGQPGDSVLSGLAILAIVVGGLGAVLLGLPKYKSPKGKGWLMGGGVAFIVGLILFSMVGAPILPGASLAPGQNGVPGQWLGCLTNANYATIGLGTCPGSLVGTKAVTKVQAGVNTTKDGWQNSVYVYFNLTLTPPSGLNTASINTVVQVTSVPTLTNTSNPSKTASVLALRAGGQYDVAILPASGTTTYGLQVVSLAPGASKVIAYQVHFSTITGQLALGQYPVGVTITFTVTDQNTGALYDTVTLTETFT